MRGKGFFGQRRRERRAYRPMKGMLAPRGLPQAKGDATHVSKILCHSTIAGRGDGAAPGSLPRVSDGGGRSGRGLRNFEGRLSKPHSSGARGTGLAATDEVDFKRVVRGEGADVPLEPGEIVYVPLSPYRYLDHYLEVILDTFVSSTAINAGTSLIGVPTTGEARIFIPVGSGVQITPPAAPPPIR